MAEIVEVELLEVGTGRLVEGLLRFGAVLPAVVPTTDDGLRDAADPYSKTKK